MTGPEHYAAAETLLASARSAPVEEDAKRWLARAQVHATLALAAATAVGTAADADSQAWAEAAGTEPSPFPPSSRTGLDRQGKRRSGETREVKPPR